jgi:hypothetical protein
MLALPLESVAVVPVVSSNFQWTLRVPASV